jgi:hypothetical protein
VNNNAWQTPFGKLLIGSTIVAAIAGFAIASGAKQELSQPLDEAVENATLPNEPDEQQALIPEASPTPPADAESTEFVTEPAPDQFESQEQYTEETVTETAAGTEGAQE